MSNEQFALLLLEMARIRAALEKIVARIEEEEV